MKITLKSDYALKAILTLAQAFGNGDVVRIQDLADKTNTPKKFLEQVLLDLKRGGFVISRRGQEGGYLLSRSPSRIRFGDVIQFIEGPVSHHVRSAPGKTDNNESYDYLFRPIWERVSAATLDVINNITFDDLVKRLQSRDEIISYSI